MIIEISLYILVLVGWMIFSYLVVKNAKNYCHLYKKTNIVIFLFYIVSTVLLIMSLFFLFQVSQIQETPQENNNPTAPVNYDYEY